MALTSRSFSYWRSRRPIFSESIPCSRSPTVPRHSTTATRGPIEVLVSESMAAVVVFTADQARRRKAKRTRKSPPKMIPSTTAARLSTSSLPRRNETRLRGRSLLPEGQHDNKDGGDRVSFAALLGDLIASANGARGAVFCGHDGEFVDLMVAQPQPPGCGELSDYDLTGIGPHLAALWLRLQDGSANGG